MRKKTKKSKIDLTKTIEGYFTRSKVFIFALIFFIAGIFASSFVFGIKRSEDLFEMWWLFVLILTAFLVLLILFWRETVYRIILILILALFLGFFYYLLFLPKIDESQIAFYNGQEVEIEGWISQEPDRRDKSVKYELKVAKTRIENGDKKITGKVLVSARRFPEFEFGDRVRVRGKLETPPAFEDFDYAAWLSKSDIYSVMRRSEIEKISEVGRNQFSFIAWWWFRVKKILLLVKSHFETTLNQVLSEPFSSLLAGILIGARRNIPDDLIQIFNIVGLTHIIALSGYNITIIVRAFERVTKYFPRWLSFSLGLSAVILFVILTGASASVVRAALMAMLILFAPLIGRKGDITIALLFTAMVMLLINLKILRYDLGFQLSFVAVAGLIYLSPILNRIIEKWKYKKVFPAVVRNYFEETFSAQIMVAPVVLYNFSRLSLVAPIMNVLVLPIVPITMLFGFVAGLLAMICLKAGIVVGYLSWLLLKYIVVAAETFSKIPLASVEKGGLHWLIIPIYYLIGTVIYFKLKKKYEKNNS